MAPTLVAVHNQTLSLYAPRHPTWTKSLHHHINVLGLDAVYDEVAAARDEVPVLHDFHFRLADAQYNAPFCYVSWVLSYKVAKLFYQAIIFIWEIAGIDSTSNLVSARVRWTKI